MAREVRMLLLDIFCFVTTRRVNMPQACGAFIILGDLNPPPSPSLGHFHLILQFSDLTDKFGPITNKTNCSSNILAQPSPSEGTASNTQKLGPSQTEIRDHPLPTPSLPPYFGHHIFGPPARGAPLQQWRTPRLRPSSPTTSR